MTMRILYQTVITIAVASLLASCTTNGQSTTQVASNFLNKQQVITTTNVAAKNPQYVTVYAKDQSPHTAYRVIGRASVSKHNILGMKRGNATLEEMMKKLAASVGGDGLINIDNNNDSMQATIIQFQKILI